MSTDNKAEGVGLLVEQAMDKSYNQAVDHCIEVVSTFLSQVPGLSEPLIVKLEKLKNPTASNDNYKLPGHDETIEALNNIKV